MSVADGGCFPPSLQDVLQEAKQRSVSLHDVESTLHGCPFIAVSQPSQYEALGELVQFIVSFGLVKDFTGQQEREYDASDFRDVRELAPLSLSCLRLLLSKLNFEEFSMKQSVNFLMPTLVLCGTHSQENFLWSSSIASSSVSALLKWNQHSNGMAKSPAVSCSGRHHDLFSLNVPFMFCSSLPLLSAGILHLVLRMTKCQTVTELLCQNIKEHPYTLFKDILLSMRPLLMKDTWTRNPSSCHVFKWLLFHVQHPYLADYLPDVLPPSLMFVDHYSTSYKVLGIECLDHIIDNVPPTELSLYGRADVIYDALFRLVYCKEPEVVTVVYPCLLKFLSGQEKNLHCSRQPRKWCHYDEVYNQLLWNMEIEDNIVLRRALSAHVAEFINRMGITITKHLKRTKRVLMDYISVHDGSEEISRINALDALGALIKVAWPRMEDHCEDFLRSILFLVYDIETERASSVQEVKETLFNHCKYCLMLMKAACPLKYMELVNSLSEITEDIPGLNFLLNISEENL